MALTNNAIQAAKPKQKPYKLTDGHGLYLAVNPAGKYWRLKYRFDGKEKLLAIGVYPDVGLKAARERRDEARKLLADGIDPNAERKARKAMHAELAANSFETVAREWITRKLADRAASHRDKVVRRLERDVFPYIGSRPIAALTAPEILTVARRVENRGIVETAHRVLQHIGQVIRYAIQTQRAETDPTPALRGALASVTPRHMAAPTDSPQSVGAILRSFDAFSGSPVVATAIRLLPLLFCRPGELRTMRWEQIDFEAAEWRFVTSKTKAEHLVPLSRQAIAILRELQPLTGHLPGGWVFTGGRTPRSPMSNMAINAGMRRMGIDTRNEVTGHGWRAVARTFLHERLSFAPEIIEHQLAHAVPDTLGRAYNRTRFIAERRQMMQQWADYLDKLKAGADVVSFRQAG